MAPSTRTLEFPAALTVLDDGALVGPTTTPTGGLVFRRARSK